MTATPFFQHIRGLILLVILFAAGVMITGVHRIPDHAVGVIRPMGNGNSLEWAEPGIRFICPMTGRLSVVPLSGTIVMASYRLGDFSEIKAVESITSDGAIVRLHVNVTYEVEAETARRIIRDYDGIFPLEYIAYETGQTMRTAMAVRPVETFRDPDNYELFLEEMAEKTRQSLKERGINLNTFRITRYEDQAAEIREMNPEEADFYRQLGVTLR